MRVTSLAPGRFFLELLGVVFCAHAVLHAWARRIGVSARPVRHQRLHQSSEFLLILARGDLGRHQTVDVVGGLGFAVVFEDEEDVGMGQSSFVELYAICERLHAAQTMLHGQVVQQRF